MSISAPSNKRKRKRIECTDEMIEQEMKMPSSSSFITPGASTSNSSHQKSFKYDVFISFSGEDIRKTFFDHLYEALDKKFSIFNDVEKIKRGKRVSDELMKAIEDSKCYIIVFSKNYASSSWCLNELVKIMECLKMTDDHHAAFPVFYDVKPTQVRNRTGAVGKAFAKHEKEVRKKRWAFGLAISMNKKKAMLKKWKGALKDAYALHRQKVEEWKRTLKGAAGLAGLELKKTLDGHEAKFIKKIVHEISLELRPIKYDFDDKLVGMETRVKDVVDSLEIGIDEVRMIGIKGIGGAGKTTLARAVFDHLSADFEASSFVRDVREVSKPSMSGLKKLQKQVLSDVLNENVNVNNVYDGKDMMKKTLCGIKVLLVLDDVDHNDQLAALASAHWFKPGSRILITTTNEHVLVAHGVNLIRDVDMLSYKEAICLFSRYAFGKDSPSQEYVELSQKAAHYAAGLPLTVKVLGLSVRVNKDKDGWVDTIESLKSFSLDTLEKLELSYISLKPDHYKEKFLDIACILKGETKDDAIRILESCWSHARICLKVLEERSLITLSSKYGQLVLGMHDQIEAMGKNIVRRSREPNEHSRLWIREEIEYILANNKGTEATKCLKFYMSRGNVRNLMKGLGKMKELRYLELNLVRDFDSERDDTCLGSDLQLDESAQYFPNSLKYLRCTNYPFLHLPKKFQANNLVGLEMEDTKMVQLWEEGEKKDLSNLKFLSLSKSNLTTFDFRITPNLETLSLKYSSKLKELCMPDTCRKLKHLNISESELITFDLGLTPNLETLSLESSRNLEKLCMPVRGCRMLKHLNISLSKLITFDLGLTPNLETLSLEGCAQFEELRMPAACPNLKYLNLSKSTLRSLDLELIPNLESLDLRGCDKLVKINGSVGCLEKVVHLNLSGCLRFEVLEFISREPKVNCFSATFYLKKLNSNLPKLLRFDCHYEEALPSSVGNIEKLRPFVLCACRDFKKFSDMICSLQGLKKLELRGNIQKFPKDLGQLECLEELCLSSTQIKHLPDSICKLKCLISLRVNGDLLEKLPNDLDQLKCLERLHVSSNKIEYLPDTICMLKSLKWLYVTDCCLGKLPDDIGQLESLERLALWGTKIKHLPDSVCELKHLKFLNLSLCDLLEKLPGNLGRLECLEKLDIIRTGISDLPQSIFGLKGLLIAVSPELLQKCAFPSEIKTTTSHIWY